MKYRSSEFEAFRIKDVGHFSGDGQLIIKLEDDSIIVYPSSEIIDTPQINDYYYNDGKGPKHIPAKWFGRMFPNGGDK